MKKSVKKKADRFAQFKNRTNSVNYRDKKGIIDQFNKSVMEYKRFVDVFKGGDEELASVKLHDAGTDLYMSCEWALKNYLYRRYNEQLANNEISAPLRTYKVDQLSTSSARIVYLIKELDNCGNPLPGAAGIKSSAITGNAKIVNNGPKHEGTIPDPSLYKESLEEIRKIIKTYVDDKAELDYIDDSIYGDGKAWYLF